MIRRRTNDRSTNRQQHSSLWRKCTDLRTLKQVHAFLLVNGFNSSLPSLRELVFSSAVAISGAIHYAHRLFPYITEPDIFMWNTMIRGSAQSGKPINAISIYTQMEDRGVKPDCFTFPFLLKACTKLFLVELGFGIHGRVVKFGFESNKFVRNTLIYFHANSGNLNIAQEIFDNSTKMDVVPWSALTAGYARRGKLDVARKLFDEMPERDLVSWNVMITGYAKQGKMENARELFDEVPKKDIVSWNAMIAGYVLSGSNEEALKMFEEMTIVGEKPDEVTILSLLSACTDLRDLEVGQKLHSLILEMGSRDLGTFLWNVLIDMYAKCGSIEEAMNVFRGIKEKDVSSWNSVISGLAFHGHAEESIDLFTEMLGMKIRPNEISFVGVLIACSHAGKVEEGRSYFNLMRNVYKIEPNIRHYGCMVDMLGRSGLLTEAFDFIDKMEIEPNAIIWRSLLGACKIHGNVEFGRLANERLVEMRSDESGDFVLLSNIYAFYGEWDGVEKMRKMMDDSGVKKEAGFSLIEANTSSTTRLLLDSKPELLDRTQKRNTRASTPSQNSTGKQNKHDDSYK